MSKNWEILSRSSEFELFWESDFQPPNVRMEERARAIWETAVRKNPGAYINGSMLAFHSVSVDQAKTVVRCIRTQYMYYFAQHRDPELDFGLRPVAVSGIVEIPSEYGPAFVIAKRGKTVTQYPGYLEFIPSGGIDGGSLADSGRADFISQLRKEFTEETGVSPDAIAAIEPFAFIHDTSGGVYDICALIRADCTGGDIKNGISKSGEYSDVAIVPRSEIESFAKKHKREFIPTSLAIIQALKK